MNWLEKIGMTLKNKFGVDFTENTTEAELIDMVEQLSGFEELQNENTELNERIELVESLNVELSTSINDIKERATNNATQLQEFESRLTAMTETVEKLAGRKLQNGHDTSKERFTQDDTLSEKAFKEFTVTINK